jgi:probable HAF family extracellular repeat protein
MRLQMSRFPILLLVLAAGFSASAAPREPPYRLVDLGTLPGDGSSQAFDVSEHRVVVGVSGAKAYWGPGEPLHAFVWDSRNGMRALPPLEGGEQCAAVAVNSAGEAVGWSETEERGAVHRHAVLWSAEGEPRDLGTLGGERSSASDLNDACQVVGSAEVDRNDFNGEPLRRAFLWEDGTMRDIGGPLPMLRSLATSINSRGHVVGTRKTLYARFRPDQGKRHAFIWRDGETRELSTPASDSSVAVAIDSKDRVLGRRDIRNDDHGSVLQVWNRGRARRIPGTPAKVYRQDVRSFNDHGTVAMRGYGGDTTAGGLLERGKPYYLGDLLDRDAWISDAASINNRGDVAGSRYKSGGGYPPLDLAVLLVRVGD